MLTREPFNSIINICFEKMLIIPEKSLQSGLFRAGIFLLSFEIPWLEISHVILTKYNSMI